jgi:hypothetical protein
MISACQKSEQCTILLSVALAFRRSRSDRKEGRCRAEQRCPTDKMMDCVDCHTSMNVEGNFLARLLGHRVTHGKAVIMKAIDDGAVLCRRLICTERFNKCDS